MRTRVFFHFNKPESQKQGKVIWTLHWHGACIPVEKILCKVPCETKANKRQPYAVMRCWASTVDIQNGYAVIT